MVPASDEAVVAVGDEPAGQLGGAVEVEGPVVAEGVTMAVRTRPKRASAIS